MGHSLGAATAVVAVVAGGGPFAGLVLCGTPKSVIGRAKRREDSSRSADVDAAGPGRARHRRRLAPVEPLRAWVAAQRGVQFGVECSVDLYEYADAGHDLLHEPVAPVVTADVAEWMLAR